MYMCTSSKVVLVANVVDVGTVLHERPHVPLEGREKKELCVCN